LIKDFVDEFARYRRIGEKAIHQVSGEALNSVLGTDNNSDMNPTKEKKPT
jgi:hypothetical protein